MMPFRFLLGFLEELRWLFTDGAPRAEPRARWTRRVPHSVLTGHAASLTPYSPDTPRPSARTHRTRRVPQPVLTGHAVSVLNHGASVVRALRRDPPARPSPLTPATSPAAGSIFLDSPLSAEGVEQSRALLAFLEKSKDLDGPNNKASPPPPSRTNWTRLVPPSRTNWTRRVLLVRRPSLSPQPAHAHETPLAPLRCARTRG